jgi:hypothetical protein
MGVFFGLLYVQGCQRQNLGPLLVPQFGSDDTGQTGPDRITIFVDQDASVVIKLDQATIFPALLFSGSDNDGMPHISSSHFVGDACAGRPRAFGTKGALFLDDNDDSVTYSATALDSNPCCGEVCSPELTDVCCRPFTSLPHDCYTFDDCSARVVDAVKHRLHHLLASYHQVLQGVELTFSCIIVAA